ncbi:DUF1048 domain-containing protein [Lacticaseibacillus sharpeae]|uniref:DNA-binding ferritin-like protein (Dps family) n=1 Tax=Lacticaseibacillus sharpeae JCM 1186 = DSM 20505 TaxID=1291052 RepID=A0A0R1ZW04_9LACO|nr:DUF1048 domain-containing protein [Lacticaseibacillus sharpeae]KRM55219.1 hypothetical protein FC18_GL001510 [Lacticaseibacillus sharpeae JCM 1186 = DSM 20505]
MTMPSWFKYLTPAYMKQVKKDKAEYKAQIARIKTLPKDYQRAFTAIQKYMWSNAAGDGMDMLNAQYDLIDFFWEGADNKIAVHDLIGDDVAAFVDGLIAERGVQTWANTSKERLNKALTK